VPAPSTDAPTVAVSSEPAPVLIPFAARTSTSTIVTKSRNNVHKPRVPSDGTILYDPDHCAFSIVPSSYRVAIADDKWRAAMEAEICALQANNTWTLVPKPPGQNVISCKWVFRIKENLDGSLDKLKAQLVARGFTQQYGIDNMEIFSPVVKPATVRLVLSLAVSKGWDIRQFDISNNFLHGVLDKSAYMQQPP
jgi:hypothetical protein